MPLLPTHRSPSHPGDFLLEDFLKPFGMTQLELADRLGIPFQRVNQIVNHRRAVTPDTALRLAALFGTTAEFWLSAQLNYDLYAALHAPMAASIKKIRPLKVKR